MISIGSVCTFSVMLCGASALTTVTTLSLRVKAALDMQRLPGIGVLVLGDAEGVLAGMGVLAEVDLRRHGAAEIDERERNARPMVALARQPGPNTPLP